MDRIKVEIEGTLTLKGRFLMVLVEFCNELLVIIKKMSKSNGLVRAKTKK